VVKVADTAAVVHADSVAAELAHVSKALFARDMSAPPIRFPLASDAVRSEVGTKLAAALRRCVQETQDIVAAIRSVGVKRVSESERLAAELDAAAQVVQVVQVVQKQFEQCEARLSLSAVSMEEKRWLVVSMLRNMLPLVPVVQVRA
jgi:hypothetical protein